MESPEKFEIRRQVPESDPIYQEERRRWRNASSQNIFAESELRLYDMNIRLHEGTAAQNRDLERQLADEKDTKRVESISASMQRNADKMEKLLRERADYLRDSFKRLAMDLYQLFAQGGYKDKKEFVLSEIGKMFDPPEIQEELKRHFGDDLSELTATNLLSKVVDGSISDEFLHTVATRHVEDVHAQEVRLAEIVEEAKTEFKTAVAGAVERGFLPKEAAGAISRLGSVVVILSDRLLAVRSLTFGSDDDSGKLSVSNELLQVSLIPQLKRTIYHEFLHELSGISVTVKTRIRDDDPMPSHRAFHRKRGVALKDDGLFYSPNRWLNEAITEWLAIELSDSEYDTSELAYKGSGFYTTERRELDRLFASGLQESEVTNAYFENFSSDQPKETKGQHFAGLVQRIDVLEGKAGFAKLENKHIMGEIDSEMYERGVHSADDTVVQKDALSPGGKIFNITISVGTSAQTTITREFVYATNPINDGSISISVAEQWKKVNSALSWIKAKYRGKIKFSVKEE